MSAHDPIRPWSEDALTSRTRAAWAAGDFSPIGRSYRPAVEEFVARLALAPEDAVLDVGCGTGSVALAAARRSSRVTGVDLAPNLIATARVAAREADHPIAFDVGDAEALPYRSHRFDLTVSMFGVMFACRPERAAAEMVRVTRRGGRLAIASWTPGGPIGSLLRAHLDAAPLPPGVPSPLAWGEEPTVRRRLGSEVTILESAVRPAALRFPFPPAAVTELFATCYGPTIATLRVLDPVEASRFRGLLTRLFEQHNSATDGGTLVIGEYLDVQARVGP